MAESRAHINLVEVMTEYICGIIPSNYLPFLQIDSPYKNRPGMVSEYIPDAYFEMPGLLIIGEAKTIKDFDTKHSKRQYQAYYDRCKLFDGMSYIIISVPWQIVPSAKNYFKLLKRKDNNETIKVIVLNELGKVAEV